MTDKELLELAAKAAGIELLCEEFKEGFKEGFIYYYYKIADDTQGWNPLNNDGDALRLAVKLGLVVDTFVETDGGYAIASTAEIFDEEPLGNDPYAATRRAIVRAAAEIGRGME